MFQNALQYIKFFYLKKAPYSLAVVSILGALLAGLLLCNVLRINVCAGSKMLYLSGDCTAIESADHQLPFCAMSPIINYFSPDKLRNKRRLASKTASVLESALILCSLTAVAVIAFYKRFQPGLESRASTALPIISPSLRAWNQKRVLFALLI